MSERMEARLCSAPRRLPGRLMMSVAPLRPATPRESQAKGLACAPRERMASASPGASRSMTRRVASGVRSRGPRPVPPTVNTSAAPCALSSSSVEAIASSSSGNRPCPELRIRPSFPQQRNHGWARGVGHQALRAAVGDGENSKQHGVDCSGYCAGRILMVCSQVSTLAGQVVMGSAVRRRP